MNNFKTAFTFLIFYIPVALSVNNEQSNSCENLWGQVLASEDKLSKWKSAESKCGVDGLFYFRYSLLSIEERKINEAIKKLTEKLNENIKNERYVELGLSTIFFQKWINSQNSHDLEEAIKYSSSIIKNHPNWSMGYEEAGLIYLVKNEYYAAFKSFKKSIELGQSTLSSHRNIVIAAYQLSKYKDAVEYGRKAVQLHNSLLIDFDFVLNLSMACAEEGLFDVGERLLIQLKNHDPSVENKAEFRKAVNYLLSLRDKQENN